MPVPLAAGWTFSKVSSLLNLLYTMTTEQTFENFLTSECARISSGKVGILKSQFGTQISMYRVCSIVNVYGQLSRKQIFADVYILKSLAWHSNYSIVVACSNFTQITLYDGCRADFCECCHLCLRPHLWQQGGYSQKSDWCSIAIKSS